MPFLCIRTQVADTKVPAPGKSADTGPAPLSPATGTADKGAAAAAALQAEEKEQPLVSQVPTFYVGKHLIW